MPVAPDPAAVEAAFHENFASRGELGAGCSVWRNGRELVSLAGGWRDTARERPWSDGTRCLWWSATKTPAAATVLLVLQRAGVAAESPVRAYWPQFAANGKDRVSALDILSHRAGLAGIPEPGLDPFDHPRVARALAAMTPLWPPRSAHGYHARTYGYLVDEIVRRLSGESLGAQWARLIAGPAGIDFHIGLPAELADSVAESVAPARHEPPAGERRFYKALATPDSLAALAFRSPGGDLRARVMNSPRARSFGFPALGGIGSASGMAKFHALLAGDGRLDGRRILPSAIVRQLATPLVSGDDLVLGLPTRFGAGAMLDPLDGNGRKLRALFGPSPRAFGHPGAGGTLAFADPDNQLAFAYVMNQMTAGILPDARARTLTAAVYSAPGAAD